MSPLYHMISNHRPSPVIPAARGSLVAHQSSKSKWHPLGQEILKKTNKQTAVINILKTCILHHFMNLTFGMLVNIKV